MKKYFILILTILIILTSFGCCSQVQLNSKYPSKSQSDLINHLTSSTVMLVEASPWGTKAYCGGVWINETHIITAKHCIVNDNDQAEYGHEIKFQTYQEFDGNYPINKIEKTYKASVIAFSDDIDIAILESYDSLPHNIARLYKHNLIQGMSVHTMSHPTGLSYNYTQGLLSQIRNMDVKPSGNDGRYYSLHITTSAASGSSGSGVFSENGELLGIACFKTERLPGALFYLHRDLVLEVLTTHSIHFY